MKKFLCSHLLVQAWTAFFIFLFSVSLINAQETSEAAKKETPADSTSTDTAATVEKQELRMSFEAFRINHEIKLLARVRSKVDKKFQNKYGIEVSFYKGEVNPDHLIGKDTSDHKGEAYWMLANASDTTVTYSAAVHDHPDYEDVDETVSINPSHVEMKLEDEDSLHLVKVFIGQPDASGQIVPVPGVECKVYVQRLFGLLQIADPETSDENGNLTVEFPSGINGDAEGNLVVVAKIAEHEVLGNVEVSQSIPWGTPVKVDNFYAMRELWSARANSPIALIFIVNAVLLGIWGVIAFIFLEIYRINKLGKTN